MGFGGAIPSRPRIAHLRDLAGRCPVEQVLRLNVPAERARAVLAANNGPLK
jgi:hypothetical protein